MEFSAALKSGDHRAALEAMRDKLADSMESADASEIAPIAARLQAVLAELAALPSIEATEVDELAARREERRAASDARVRAKRRRRTEHRT